MQHSTPKAQLFAKIHLYKLQFVSFLLLIGYIIRLTGFILIQMTCGNLKFLKETFIHSVIPTSSPTFTYMPE